MLRAVAYICILINLIFMHKFKIAAVMLFFFALGFSQQKQNNHWHFGFHAHLNFTSGSPAQPTNEYMPVNNGFTPLEYLEGCASVSDFNTGSPIFYSQGSSIFNGTTHSIITNGSGLKSGNSNAQGIVFLPKPKSNNIFYVFTIDGYTGYNRGVFYSEINRTTNSVTANKNIPLKDHSGINIDEGYFNTANLSQTNQAESIVTAKHTNGIDYWVIVHVNNYLYTYLVDCTGVNLMPYKSYSFSANYPNIQEDVSGWKLKIAQNDQQVVRIAKVFTTNFGEDEDIITGTFDRSTGTVLFNNTIALDKSYALEFSKSGDVLYFGDNQDIKKYNFLNGQTSLLFAGVYGTAGGPLDNPELSLYYDLQLAPDNLIYVSAHGNKFLGRINNPDNFSASTYTHNALTLVGLGGLQTTTAVKASIGLPQLVSQHTPYVVPTFVINNDAFTFNNASTITTTQTVFGANPTNPDTMNGSPVTLNGFPNLTVIQVGSLSPQPTNGNVILNPNGTITILAGTTPGTYTLQYKLATVSPCPEYSSVGTVTVTIQGFNVTSGTDREVFSFCTQNDNKIILGGAFNYYNGLTRNKIVRLNSDLSIDSTFDVGTGIVQDQNGVGSVFSTLLQSDNKIIVAGGFNKYKNTSVNAPLIRLLPNGDLDTTFVTPVFQSISSTLVPLVYSIALDNNKIVAVGEFKVVHNGVTYNRVVRLNADGSIDASFNHVFNSQQSIDYSSFRCVRVNSGKVLVSGSYSLNSGSNLRGMVRFNSDGTMDQTFNQNAYVTGGIVNFEIIPSTNKIIAGGNFTTYDGYSRKNIVLLDSNGYVDASFNPGSGFESEMAGRQSRVNTIALLPGIGFYIGGHFDKYNGNNVDNVCKIGLDGVLDSGFSTGSGFVGYYTRHIDDDSVLHAIKLQSDGKLLIGGFFHSYNGQNRSNFTRLVPSVPGAEGRISSETKDELSDVEKINIYPNPSNGIINVDLREFNDEVFGLTVYNLIGQRVMSAVNLKNNTQIDINSLQKGSYLVVLSNEKMIVKRTVIKQ